MFSAAIKSGSAGTPKDPQFNYVTMLLHGDGTNGAQNNTFLDSSTNNFTITRVGNTTQGTFTPYGSNWSNYISTGYLGFSTITLGASYTIEFFVNFPSAPSGNNIVISNAGGGGGTNWIGITTTNLTFSYGGTNRTFSFTPVGGTWYYVQIIGTASTVSAYVNGSQIGTTQTGPTSFTVDRIAGYPSVGFTGYLSNLRVTNAANSVSAMPTTPLTAIANCVLLTCQSNRFVDNSASPYTLTPSSDISVQRFSPFIPTTPYSSSVIGGSSYMDGSGDYLTAPSTSGQLGSGNFTIECWSYLTSKSTLYPCIWGNYTSFGAGSFAIFAGHDGADTTKYNVAINGTFPAIQSTTSIIYNQWTHIALVRNSTTITLYINGVANGTATSSATLNGTSGITYIGTAGDNVANGYINGYLTDYRNLVGTALYTTAFTPPTTPLTAITNTKLLLNYTNAGIFDNAMMNDLETVGDAQISTSIKKYGTGSMAFDGTGDYLVAPNAQNLFSFGTGDFTIECWAYLNSFGADQGIIDCRSAGDGLANWVFNIRSGGVVDFIYGSTRLQTAGLFSTSTWVHIAITRASGTIRIFVNGTNSASATYTSAINSRTTTPNIGRVIDPSYMNGYIDDLRITKGYARYTANFTPPTAAFPNN
jgi:hypothetical protein